MFLNRKRPVQARKVGNTLVVAFHNSDPSLIWKFDLERNHSFTLALQGEEGDLELGVTSAKGEFYPIARFSTREDAEQAFIAVQKVLMKKTFPWPRGILAWLGILFLVFVIIILAGKYLFNGTVSKGGSPVSSAPARIAPPEIPSGVPVPADQALKPPL